MGFSMVGIRKPLTIVIGKTLDELKGAAFWTDELPGLANYPPTGPIDIIAIKDAPECNILVKEIRSRISEIVKGSRRITGKWQDREDSFTCRKGKDSPKKKYPTPLWTVGQLWQDDAFEKTGGKSGHSADSIRDICGLDERDIFGLD